MISKKGTVKATEKKAIAEIEMFLLKKDSEHITTDQSINWTVTVNESQINFGSAGSSYDVTDKIPEGLKLTSVSLDDTPFTGYTYSGGAGYSGGTLVVPVSDGAKHEIKYTTEINPTIWQKNPNATFKNAVSYEPVSGKGKFERTKAAECIFAGTDKGIMTAVGTYDTSNHTFTWTIGINQHGTAIPNGVIDISIPDGHSYSDITLPTNWTMVPTTPDTTTKTIKVTADPPGSLNGDIILKTTADDEKLWAVNLPKDLEKDYSITTKFTSTSQTSTALLKCL